MNETTDESIVENDKIQADAVRPPEDSLIDLDEFRAGIERVSRFRIASPRLANPEHAADFIYEVTWEPKPGETG